MTPESIKTFYIIIVAIITIILYLALFYAWFNSVFKFPLKQIPNQLKKELKKTWKNYNKLWVIFIVLAYTIGVPAIVYLCVSFIFLGSFVFGNFLFWLF